MIWGIELKSESHALNLWVWFSLFTLPIGHASRKPRAQRDYYLSGCPRQWDSPKISIDLVFQKKIYQERNGQDSFQSLTLIEFGLKIWLQSSSKHRWDFYLCHLCTSCRRNWTTHARYSSEVRTAEISKSGRKIWSSWQIFGYMQANKSYFIHLDPSTQSAILSKQLVSMFEIIGMADKNLMKSQKIFF